ncbi:cation:dicarboxylate symporter family transporter [Thiobacillus sp.]
MSALLNSRHVETALNPMAAPEPRHLTRQVVIAMLVEIVLGGVDRLLDMMRTLTNVTGDCAVGCIVAKSEKAFGQAVFDDAAAGSVEAATRDSLPSHPVS